MAAFKQTRSSMPDSSTKPPVRRFSTEEGEYLVQDEVFLRNDGSTDKTVTTALTFRDFLTGRTVPLRLRRIPEQRAAVTVSAEERKLDSVFMREALLLAREAFDGSEVPVGAVVVKDGKIISRGRNRVMELPDPTAHAEVLAIRDAARVLHTMRLTGCTLYTTLELCYMCAGALVHSRVDRIVFGAADPRTGSCGSVFTIAGSPLVNHRFRDITGGVMAEECGRILQEFFESRRHGRPG